MLHADKESENLTPLPSIRVTRSSTCALGCPSLLCQVFAAAVVDVDAAAAKAVSVDDALVVFNACDVAVVEAASDDLGGMFVYATAALSGGSSAPDIVGNACCVAMLSWAMAKSR